MNRHHTFFAVLLVMFAVTRLPAATITVLAAGNEDGTDPRGGIQLNSARHGEVGTDIGPGGKTIQTWVGDFNTGSFKVNWEIQFDPDPMVNEVLAIENTGGTTLFYDTTVLIPSTVAVPSNGILIGSSSITVADTSDDNVNAAMSATTIGDSAIYSALIGNTSQGTLFDYPKVLTASQLGTTNFDNDQFPSGSTTSTALPENGDFGIRHTFRLTAGDTGTFNSTLVLNVPSPTGSILLWLGVTGLCFCRRKLIRR